jgi:hypothetical protein
VHRCSSTIISAGSAERLDGNRRLAPEVPCRSFWAGSSDRAARLDAVSFEPGFDVRWIEAHEVPDLRRDTVAPGPHGGHRPALLKPDKSSA